LLLECSIDWTGDFHYMPPRRWKHLSISYHYPWAISDFMKIIHHCPSFSLFERLNNTTSRLLRARTISDAKQIIHDFPSFSSLTDWSTDCPNGFQKIGFSWFCGHWWQKYTGMPQQNLLRIATGRNEEIMPKFAVRWRMDHNQLSYTCGIPHWVAHVRPASSFIDNVVSFDSCWKPSTGVYHYPASIANNCFTAKDVWADRGNSEKCHGANTEKCHR